MSLRKSPKLTSQARAAARRNAQHSTGPRSQASKQHSKMNAVRHGERAAPGNHHDVMRALGEYPEEFENLKQELMTSFGPGDALWEKQIDDLARLYWRRERIERAQSGLMRRALQAVEEWQRTRRKQMAAVTFDPSQSGAIDISLGEPGDPGVRLRMLLSLLGVIRAQVRQRVFKSRQKVVLESYYQGEPGWRQARLRHLLWLFKEWAERQEQNEEEELKEFVNKYFERGESGVEAHYQELLRLLDEEIARVQEELEYAEKVNEEKAAIERDACLAPAGDEWKMMLRREETLDRSIDRKIKILLSLRKQNASVGAALVAAEGGHKDRAGTGPTPPSAEVGATAVVAHGSTKRSPASARGEAPVAASSGCVPSSTVAAQGGSTATPLQQKIYERTGNVAETKGLENSGEQPEAI